MWQKAFIPEHVLTRNEVRGKALTEKTKVLPKPKEWMNMSNAYIIHTDFDEIIAEITKLQEVDKKAVDEVTSFVDSLKEITVVPKVRLFSVAFFSNECA